MIKFRTQWQDEVRQQDNSVVMDDDSITEQQGYMTNQQMYDEMIRSGRQLRAHRLHLTMDELEELEQEGDFETHYELDITEQMDVVKRYQERMDEEVARREKLAELEKQRSEAPVKQPEAPVKESANMDSN